MKALLSLALIAISFNANARSIELPHRMGLDFSNGQYATVVKQIGTNKKVSSAEIKIVGDEVTVELYANNCPKGAMCFIGPIKVGEISAQIVERSESCGSKVYVARRDDTPRDGSRDEIVIQDNSTRQCRDMRPGLIEASASSYNPWTNKTASVELLQHYSYEEPTQESRLNLRKGEVLNKVVINGQEEGPMYKGSIKLNWKTRKAVLTYQYHPCKGDGMVCMAISAERTEELMVISKSYSCGSIVYQAQSKNMVPGGQVLNVRIMDHSQRICDDVVPSVLVVEGTISQAISPRYKPTTIYLEQ